MKSFDQFYKEAYRPMDSGLPGLPGKEWDEYKKKWVDPIELTPAFLKLASGKYKHLIGKHVNAWDLSNKDKK